jgi:hypothetical protein
MHLAFISIIGLSFFFVLVEPLARKGLIDGLEHVLDAVECLFDSIGQTG